MKSTAPGSLSHIVCLCYLFSFALIFRSIKPKIPKIFTLSFIYLYQISLLQVTVKGLTTPLSRWVHVVDCLCRYSVTCALSPNGLIPWFSKLREILYFAASSFPLQGKTNASSRGSKKDFWRCCREMCTKSSQDLISTSHF